MTGPNNRIEIYVAGMCPNEKGPGGYTARVNVRGSDTRVLGGAIRGGVTQTMMELTGTIRECVTRLHKPLFQSRYKPANQLPNYEQGPRGIKKECSPPRKPGSATPPNSP